MFVTTDTKNFAAELDAVPRVGEKVRFQDASEFEYVLNVEWTPLHPDHKVVVYMSRVPYGRK